MEKKNFHCIILNIFLFSSCTVVKTDFSDTPIKKATVYYYLPESIIKIRSTVKVAVVYGIENKKIAEATPIEQRFIASTEMVSDTKNLLSLNYIPNIFMSDEIKYGVNSKGLLETVNISTDDRTSEIISKLAEAPQIILGITTGGKKILETEIVKIKEYTAEFIIKASSISSELKTIDWNILIENELVEDEPKAISGSFQINSLDIIAPPKLSTLINGNESSKETKINGILTRPLKNIQLNIQSITSELNKPLPINIVIADVSRLINIPVKRTAFVKRVNKIGIQDGVILSNEINKPSSVEGFASIPINIVKAIVSIPGQLIQFKYDNTKRLDELEKAKLNYEKSIQETQKFTLTKEQEIDKVKLSIQKTELSNQIELQKLKLELEKSLLEAEKNKTNAQKELDILKKEIDLLKSKK